MIVYVTTIWNGHNLFSEALFKIEGKTYKERFAYPWNSEVEFYAKNFIEETYHVKIKEFR